LNSILNFAIRRLQVISVGIRSSIQAVTRMERN